MFSTFKRFLDDEAGATAIEYGLIAAGIAVAILAVLKALGKDLVASLQFLLNELNAMIGG
jgi:pilus assembly protein Flp/PilA